MEIPIFQMYKMHLKMSCENCDHFVPTSRIKPRRWKPAPGHNMYGGDSISVCPFALHTDGQQS